MWGGNNLPSQSSLIISEHVQRKKIHKQLPEEGSFVRGFCLLVGILIREIVSASFF